MDKKSKKDSTTCRIAHLNVVSRNLNIEKCHDKFIRSNIQILLRRALIIGLQDFVLYMTEAKAQSNTQIYTTMCLILPCVHTYENIQKIQGVVADYKKQFFLER
jgi:hypothetical protein